MATTKRERQKAARRERLERLHRQQQRRKNLRRGIIVAIIAVLVVGTGAFLFSGKNTPPTTTTSTSTSTTPTTTTTIPTSFPAVKDPSPAGTFGTAPTVTVPAGAPPTAMELSNLITGTGAVAKTGDSVKIKYVLATYSSRKVVQSDWTTGGDTFTVGTGTIVGFGYGLVGMRVGGRREIIIPPSLGYGDEAGGTGIAANDTLVFVIDLIKVTPAA
jgi:peptidylprolyl isomerase